MLRPMRPSHRRRTPRGLLAAFAGLLIVLGLFQWFCGFYVVPPGAGAGDGETAIVWRTGEEPFFNSPATAGGRSGPAGRVLVGGLPFWSWGYRQSLAATAGRDGQPPVAPVPAPLPDSSLGEAQGPAAPADDARPGEARQAAATPSGQTAAVPRDPSAGQAEPDRGEPHAVATGAAGKPSPAPASAPSPAARASGDAPSRRTPAPPARRPARSPEPKRIVEAAGRPAAARQGSAAGERSAEAARPPAGAPAVDAREAERERRLERIRRELERIRQEAARSAERAGGSGAAR